MEVSELWLQMELQLLLPQISGEYQTAAQTFETLLKQKECPPEVNLYLCCAYLMIGHHDEARKIAEKRTFLVIYSSPVF